MLNKFIMDVDVDVDKNLANDLRAIDQLSTKHLLKAIIDRDNVLISNEFATINIREKDEIIKAEIGEIFKPTCVQKFFCCRRPPPKMI